MGDEEPNKKYYKYKPGLPLVTSREKSCQVLSSHFINIYYYKVAIWTLELGLGKQVCRGGSCDTLWVCGREKSSKGDSIIIIIIIFK
jgi:hypothetical protein